MSLDLIVGPPNSGRAGEVLGRLRAALEREPLLVVPTGDDVVRFERDLCAGGNPAVGATIRTFSSVADEIAAATAARIPPRLSPPQRLALMRSATAATQLRVLARSARSPGFATALDTLVAELQAALVSPADLRAAAAAMPAEARLEHELADLYEAYERLRDNAGRSDAGSVAAAAAAALRRDPAGWGNRPVLIYGFDDLTEAQLELLRLLAATCEVTVAVNYADRKALAARAALLLRLRDELGATTARALDFDPGYTSRKTLAHLDRELFEPAAERVPADDGLQLLESAGERGEAESVGLEVARLLAAGVAPDGIVVVLRRPGVDGPLFASVLRAQGVPVALQAELPLVRTAVGRSLLALCRAASPEGEPADLLAHLRADPSVAPRAVDWLERAVLRGEAESVAAVAERWETPPRHLARVLDAPGPAARVAALAVGARRLAEGAHRERAPLAGERSAGVPLDAIELRAGVAAAELLEELALVGGLPGCAAPDLGDAAEALEAAGVRAWQGSVEGRVRIVSPYRVRAGQATHLFCAGLQEGVFPGRGAIDPLLGEAARADLGIPALRRREQAEEERYLFHVCASRPVERLYLSWRSSDEDGHPAPRSPFVDEVLDLIGDGSDAAEAEMKRVRGLARPVPAAGEASTARALARAITLAAGPDSERRRELLGAVGADLATSGDVLALCDGIPPAGSLPGPLRNPAVLAELESRRLLSANSLEGWIECSYRWFVNHELVPQRLEPEPDPLWLGGVVHEALDRLYSEAPGADSIPRLADLTRWQERFDGLLDDVIAERDSPETPDRRLALERLRMQVREFLATEAQGTSPLRPRPGSLEQSFGFEDSEEEPGTAALDLGAFALRGRIDRIDIEPGGRRALLRDYKISKKVPGAAQMSREGKLQLQLYMLAAEAMGLEPIGGFYQPLGAYDDRRPRGIVRKDECDDEGLLAGLEPPVRGDAIDPEAFDRALAEARGLAIAQGARMRTGDIDRDPLEGSCPKYCTFQAICRLERSIGLEGDTENGE